MSKKAAKNEDMRRYYRLRDEGEWGDKEGEGKEAGEEEGQDDEEEQHQQPRPKAGRKEKAAAAAGKAAAKQQPVGKGRKAAAAAEEEEEEESSDEPSGEGEDVEGGSGSRSGGEGEGEPEGDAGSSGSGEEEEDDDEDAEAKRRWARARGLVGERRRPQLRRLGLLSCVAGAMSQCLSSHCALLLELTSPRAPLGLSSGGACVLFYKSSFSNQLRRSMLPAASDVSSSSDEEGSSEDASGSEVRRAVRLGAGPGASQLRWPVREPHAKACQHMYACGWCRMCSHIYTLLHVHAHYP